MCLHTYLHKHEDVYVLTNTRNDKKISSHADENILIVAKSMGGGGGVGLE